MSVDKIKKVYELRNKIREEESRFIPVGIAFTDNGWMNVKCEVKRTSSMDPTYDSSSDIITMYYARKVIAEMGEEIVEAAIKMRDEHLAEMEKEAKEWALSYATGAEVEFK